MLRHLIKLHFVKYQNNINVLRIYKNQFQIDTLKNIAKNHLNSLFVQAYLSNLW